MLITSYYLEISTEGWKYGWKIAVMFSFSVIIILVRSMSMSKRIKTKYTGVFYREAKRIGKSGSEKVFYIILHVIFNKYGDLKKI